MTTETMQLASDALAGRTVVVTGASSGIGRAVAERLGGLGAHVWLAGRDRAPMDASAEAIVAAGGQADVRSVDLRQVAAVQGLVEEAHGTTGRFDIMVNNAGLGYGSSILEGHPEQWREMFEVNVIALLVGCQAAVRAMRMAGLPGHIVNISSTAALLRDSGVYGATKHAVNCISASLREELEDDPIRVVNIMPGVIATNFARNLDPEMVAGVVRAAGLDVAIAPGDKLPDEVNASLHERMRTMVGHPDDVARAVVFAVTQPPELNIEQVVVRPAKRLPL
ncbi:MAG: SDR family oxidoreductase [Pseudomonadales bacterium]|nr:SDR family oxidoreductase [Pseudomonadales bacterium]